MKKTNLVIKGLVVFIAIILIVAILVLLGQANRNSPTSSVIDVDEESVTEISTLETAEIPEQFQVNFITGVIKEVKESSVVVANMATKKDVEVGFNSSTRITKGEGSGEAVTEAELAT
ncbi:hypothetical protein K0B03_02950, partial [Patescibacteria group bacterium]|nr:hypothetical protein [Patescibacteria group bacterium]